MDLETVFLETELFDSFLPATVVVPLSFSHSAIDQAVILYCYGAVDCRRAETPETGVTTAEDEALPEHDNVEESPPADFNLRSRLLAER